MNGYVLASYSITIITLIFVRDSAESKAQEPVRTPQNK